MFYWTKCIFEHCREIKNQKIENGKVCLFIIQYWGSVTRKLNKISPNFWKKWPKIPKHLHQSLIKKTKTSTLNYFWNLQTNCGCLGACMFGWKLVKQEVANGEISLNLVTLYGGYHWEGICITYTSLETLNEAYTSLTCHFSNC